MNIYIYGTSEIKLELQDDYSVYFPPVEELMSLLISSPESDIFVWQYDYPWNDTTNKENVKNNKFEAWNEKHLYILSMIKKTKRKVVFFNKNVISLSTVLKHITNPEENKKNHLDISCKKNELLNIHLGMLLLWGKKYWRTLECLEGISLRPSGVKPIKKSMFTSSPDEKLTLAVNLLLSMDGNNTEISSLKNFINLRFDEIATLTLMLQESQSSNKTEALKNSKLAEIVKKNSTELKTDAAIIHEQNQNLEKLKNEINTNNVLNKNFQKKIGRLTEELNESKKSLSSRFDELVVLTDMLEKANEEISGLKEKLVSAYERHEKIKNSFSWKATAPIRALSNPVKAKKDKSNKKLNKIIQLIKESEYFNSEWYLLQNPDVKDAGVDPAKHYLLFGGFENRDPSTKFSNAIYFELHPDVKDKGINPLEHYITFGVKENRRISY